MKRLTSRLALGVAFAAAFAAVSIAQRTPGATDWSSSNYDQSANRYSPLAQITTKNVATLQQVWSYHLKPAELPAVILERDQLVRLDLHARPQE
jgi:quinoprotein glucose dehydrogenase